MERFGIFELLDALSALPREGADQRAEAGQKTPAEEERLWREGATSRPIVEAGSETKQHHPLPLPPPPPRSGDTEKAPLSDGGTARGREDGTSPAAGESASPNAPGGRTAHDPAPNAPDGRAAHDPAPKALESFLKRHDALSKKAEKH